MDFPLLSCPRIRSVRLYTIILLCSNLSCVTPLGRKLGKCSMGQKCFAEHVNSTISDLSTINKITREKILPSIEVSPTTYYFSLLPPTEKKVIHPFSEENLLPINFTVKIHPKISGIHSSVL